jgi:NAD(P)H-dependent FMN reductase
MALIGASPGGFGTVSAQTAWLPVLRTLGTRPYFGGRLVLSHAHRAFNDDGEMTDAVTKDRLRDFMRGFVEFIEQNKL